MPIYPFVCDACGYETERVNQVYSVPEETCAQCGGMMRQCYTPASLFVGRLGIDSHRKFSAPHKPNDYKDPHDNKRKQFGGVSI